MPTEHNNYTQAKCCFFCKYCINELKETTYYCKKHNIGPSPVFVCNIFEWKQWVLNEQKKSDFNDNKYKLFRRSD